jgi:hypothetical protein
VLKEISPQVSEGQVPVRPPKKRSPALFTAQDKKDEGKGKKKERENHIHITEREERRSRSTPSRGQHLSSCREKEGIHSKLLKKKEKNKVVFVSKAKSFD